MHWPLWAADREGDEHAGGGSGVLVGPPPRDGLTQDWAEGAMPCQ